MVQRAMAKRPGPTPMGGAGGCFVLVFFLPFAGFGIFAMVMGAGALAGSVGSGRSVAGALPFLLLGTIFTLVGIGGVYGGLKTVLGTSRRDDPLKPPALPGDPLTSP